MSDKNILLDTIGTPAMLEQTAEEGLELAFACLKLARMLRGENGVHGYSKEELVENIEEEIADVIVCIGQMSGEIVSNKNIAKWVGYKKRRMKKRLMDISEDEA